MGNTTLGIHSLVQMRAWGMGWEEVATAGPYVDQGACSVQVGEDMHIPYFSGRRMKLIVQIAIYSCA